MSQELIYTSAPQGLKPGTRGFCTVACTHGMSPPLAERLESLSGYRQLFAAHDAQANLNPVIYSHLVLSIGGRKYHVLSRVADAGLDYTQRSNKFAHHVALDAAELPPGGPAWLLMQPGFMQTDWDGEPKLLSSGRRPPSGFAPPTVCHRWQELTGDAGWAGVLAETAVGPSARQAYLVFRPGQDLLPLVAEALALVPMQRRWEITFSTWFTKLPPGIDCQWRCLLADSPEAKAARRQQQALLIDLTAPLPNAGSGALAQSARTGIMSAVAQPAPRAPTAAQQPPAIAPTGVISGPPPFAGASEYALGPSLTHSLATSPTLLIKPGKKRSKSRKALLVSIVAAVLLMTIAGASVGVYVLATKKPALAVAQLGATDNKPSNDSNSGNAGIQLGNVEESEGTEKSENVPAASEPRETDSVMPGNETGHANEIAGASSRPPPSTDVNQGGAEGGGPVVKKVDPPLPPEASAPPRPSDPFAALKARGIDLQSPKPSIGKTDLARLGPLDPAALKLEIVGWEKLQPDFSISYPARPSGPGSNDVQWTIIADTKPKTPAPRDEIGIFSLENEYLRFKWGKKHRLCLRNCLLKLSIDGQHDAEALVPLRAPIALSHNDITIKDESSCSIDLSVDDVPLAVNQKLLRLKLAVDEKGNADSVKTVILDPRDGTVDPRDNHAAIATIKFDPRASIKIEARLVTKEAGTRITIQFRWLHQVFDAGRLVDKNIGLSIKAVTSCRAKLPNSKDDQKWADQIEELRNKLATLEDDRNRCHKEVMGLTQPKGKEDPDATKRKALEDKIKKITEKITQVNKEINDLDQQRRFFSEEPRRCEELIGLLRELPGKIGLTAYYQLGERDDPNMRVILAETKHD
jgi:hypothetical protein